MWNLKYITNELIYKRETDSRHREQTCVWLPRGREVGEGVGEGWMGCLGLADANSIHRMDKQQGLTVTALLYAISCDELRLQRI